MKSQWRVSLARPVSVGEGSGTCGLSFFRLASLRAIRALKINQHEVGRAGILLNEAEPDTSGR